MRYRVKNWVVERRAIHCIVAAPDRPPPLRKPVARHLSPPPSPHPWENRKGFSRGPEGPRRKKKPPLTDVYKFLNVKTSCWLIKKFPKTKGHST